MARRNPCIHDNLDQDFDSFLSPIGSISHSQPACAGSSQLPNRPFIAAMPNVSYGQSNMDPFYNISEEPWSGQYRPILEEFMSIDTPSEVMTVPKAKGNASVSDSGYGSIEYSENTEMSSMGGSFYYSSFDRDLCLLPATVRSMSKAKGKVSETDSEYSSIAYPDGKHVSSGPVTCVDNVADFTYNSTPNYCEICDRDLDKRKYFNNNADRKKHMFTHTRPFKCDVPDCGNQNGFASPHDLARHKKSCHSVLTVKSSKFYYQCAAPKCRTKDKIWPRKDNFKAHLEGTHKYSEAKVVEMMRRSECTPTSTTLPAGSVKRQRNKRRKPKKTPFLEGESCFEKESMTTTESSMTDSAYCNLEGIGAMFEDSKPEPTSSHMMSLELLGPIFEEHSQKPDFEGKHLPEILISDPTEVDNEGGPSSPARSVVMLDASATPAECTDSPFFVIQPPSPTLSSFEGLLTPYTPGTDTESFFETDLDDLSTENEFDSDVCEIETIFQPLFPLAVQRLLLAYMAFRQRTQSHNTNTQSSSNRSSFGSQSKGNPSGSTCLPKQQVGGKRRRNADEDDDDEERLPRRKGKAAKVDEEQTPFACPFNKFDPHRYSNCYTFVLNGISRVKQHLERKHSAPIHCPKCYIIFHDDPDARDDHVWQDICIPSPERRRLGGISEAQMRQIKPRTPDKKTAEERWYAIFELLFPNATRPTSPYMDRSLSAELSHFRDFSQREGPEIVASVVRESSPTSIYQFYPREQLENFTRQVHQQAMQQLFVRYAQLPPFLRHSSSANSLSPGRAAGAQGITLTPPETSVEDHALQLRRQQEMFLAAQAAQQPQQSFLFNEIMPPPSSSMAIDDMEGQDSYYFGGPSDLDNVGGQFTYRR